LLPRGAADWEDVQVRAGGHYIYAVSHPATLCITVYWGEIWHCYVFAWVRDEGVEIAVAFARAPGQDVGIPPARARKEKRIAKIQA